MKITLIALLILLAGFLAYNFLSKTKHSMNSDINLSPSEFSEKLKSDRGIVIDVRTESEYSDGHLSLADYQYNVMNGEFESQLDSLNKNETYYLYCRSGNRSGRAASIMKSEGFENVYNIGGFQKLANEGFETN